MKHTITTLILLVLCFGCTATKSDGPAGDQGDGAAGAAGSAGDQGDGAAGVSGDGAAGSAGDPGDDTDAGDEGDGAAADACNPLGTWTITITIGEGDCLSAGGTDQLEASVSDEDLETIDRDACQLSKIEPYNSPETDELYEIDGAIEYLFSFTGDQLEGTATLHGQLYEGGELVGECEQAITLQGSRG